MALLSLHHPCNTRKDSKPKCTSSVSPQASTSGHSPYCLIAQWQRRGEREGDSTWFGLSVGKSGRDLGEPLLPITGASKPKARDKANPDIKPCASCSHAPSYCTISRSSTHSTLCQLMNNVSGLLRQIQQHNPSQLQCAEAKATLSQSILETPKCLWLKAKQTLFK